MRHETLVTELKVSDDGMLVIEDWKNPEFSIYKVKNYARRLNGELVLLDTINFGNLDDAMYLFNKTCKEKPHDNKNS